MRSCRTALASSSRSGIRCSPKQLLGVDNRMDIVEAGVRFHVLAMAVGSPGRMLAVVSRSPTSSRETRRAERIALDEARRIGSMRGTAARFVLRARALTPRLRPRALSSIRVATIE